MSLTQPIPTPPQCKNHDHIYTILLGVLGFLILISISMLAAMRPNPDLSADSKAGYLLPLAAENSHR